MRLTRLQAPRLGSQSTSCPSKELGRRVSGNPEPDKQHLCSCLDTCQAASFPRADLMFLKSLKTPEVCVLPLLVQFSCQQRKWPRLGATRRGGDKELSSPPWHPLCQSLLPVPRDHFRRNERHPLTSEVMPILICLPASANPKVSLETTFTLRLFLLHSRLLDTYFSWAALRTSLKSVPSPQRVPEGSGPG